MAGAAGQRLAGSGLPGRRSVCVVGRKSPDLVAVLLACFRSGHQVLLPPADLGEATLLQLCTRAGCEYLVRVGPGHGELAVRALPAGDTAAPCRLADRPGLLLTTSGSTGLPKVVPLSAAGVDRFVGWAAGQFGLGPGAVVFNYAPLNFDLCLLDVWTSLARGAAVVLVGEDGATDGGRLLDLVADSTLVQAVPMLFRLLTQAAGGRVRLPAARHVVFTGDALPPDLLPGLRQLFPEAALHNLYGCTETNDSFRFELPGDPAAVPAGPLPIGRPIPGVDHVVLDADGRVLTGPGSGELVVHTPFQADGYLDPALDEGRFVPAPAGFPPGRWYRTGDLVRRDDTGLLNLLCRADFQVKVRGVRVNTQEVEAVLGEHAAVREAVVLAVPDRLAGHRLHAVVRCAPRAAVNSLQLRQHCAARLARTAIPGRIEIVDEPLPRTTTGKLDRSGIRRSRLEGN
jgi:acyl-coenzyme A synthetase/AMP-(fatty) acid ligase